MKTNKQSNKIIYLAIPFEWDVEEAFKIANQIAGKLMINYNTVFSPISHLFPITEAVMDEWSVDLDFWEAQNLPFIKFCNKVIVVDVVVDGERMADKDPWINKVLKTAKEAGVRVMYMEYNV